MTERDLLRQLRNDFEAWSGEIESRLVRATAEQWQAVHTDNGWTTAQIVEHMCRSRKMYGDVLPKAFDTGPRGDGTAEVKHSFIGGQILGALKRFRPPAPSKLVESGRIEQDVALARWRELRSTMENDLERAEAVHLTATKFRNPAVPIFTMNLADALAILVVHLNYHRPQIERRIP